MKEVEVKGVNLARETGGMALGRDQLLESHLPRLEKRPCLSIYS